MTKRKHMQVQRDLLTESKPQDNAKISTKSDTGFQSGSGPDVCWISPEILRIHYHSFR